MDAGPSEPTGPDEIDAPLPSPDQRFERAPRGRNRGRIPRDPNYGHIGGAISIGINGVTGDLAFPINRFFDFRLGGSGFAFRHVFPERATDSDPTSTIDVVGSLQVAYGKAQVDWYPLAGHFRISPMLMFANYTHGVASVTFPPGQEFDLEEGSFVSSPTDPVQGYGRVDYRHTAPGLTVGFNNFTRGYGRFTFPVEIGAFYMGAPTLQIGFNGSVCTNTGCEKAEVDPNFQMQLDAEKARINDQLHKYAQFLPVLNVGVGYRFGTYGR